MPIEKGDIVTLAGSVMLKLAKDHPDVFEDLKEREIIGGEVVLVNNETLHIDLGRPQPLILDSENGSFSEMVQVVQKGLQPDCDRDRDLDPSQLSMTLKVV